MRCQRFLLISLVLVSLFVPDVAFAGPKSTNYEFKEYSFGTSSEQSTSPNYSLFNTIGEEGHGKSVSTNFQIGQGLAYTMLANVPGTPSLTNPATNYDRLLLTISTGNNASDTKFAVAISTDNFASDVRYVKNDFTIGTTLTSTDYLDYPGWGGASGVYITGLLRNTTYYVKVKAKQGMFTESGYSQLASAVTSDPSLSFGTDSPSVTFSNLNAGNAFTDTSKSTILTTSTNAYNGYIVYAKVTAPLTYGAATIANYPSPNSSPTTWSGTGFGYSSNDSALSGGTANRFTNGGSKYAGFNTASADPVADHTSVVVNPAISNEQFTINYRVTADSTTNAGNYRNTIMYIVVPSY